jgi:hypothetical protein
VGAGLPAICCEAAVKPDSLVYLKYRVYRITAGTRQIAGKPAPTACGQNQKQNPVRVTGHLQSKPHRPESKANHGESLNHLLRL